MTIVEFYDSTPIENMVSCLAYRPEKIIFIGDKKELERKEPHFYRFLDEVDNFETVISFKGVNRSSLGELIRVLTYVCLILVPYPMMCFFAGAVGESRSVLLTVTLLLCLLNFFSTVLLTCFGLTDYYYMVNITHLVLLLSFAAVIFLVGRAIRRGSVPGELLRVLVVGTIASISGAGIDLVRYHLKAEGSFSGFTRIGVLLFIVLMGIYMFSAQIQLMRKKQEEDRTFIIEITDEGLHSRDLFEGIELTTLMTI